MKIKTDDWLGVKFSARASVLRYKTFNDMYDASRTSGGQPLPPDLLEQRREVVKRLNTDAKEWDHYLFTEKALKLARAIDVDRDQFNWRLLRDLLDKPEGKDRCYLSGPEEFFRWFLFEGGVAVMHLFVEHQTKRIMRHTYSLGFDNTESPGLDPSRDDVWPSAQRFLQLLVFTELTEVDLLLVDAGTKSTNTKAPETLRVTNQTEVPLIRVHAHWNTCVINTSIIGVRGFYRHQPWGPRHLRQTKRIYIEPHERKGYVRTAKTSS